MTRNQRLVTDSKLPIVYDVFSLELGTTSASGFVIFQREGRAPAVKSKWDDSHSSADEGQSKKKEQKKKDSKKALPKYACTL